MRFQGTLNNLVLAFPDLNSILLQLLKRKTAEVLFNTLHIERWAFDVEMLKVSEVYACAECALNDLSFMFLRLRRCCRYHWEKFR